MCLYDNLTYYFGWICHLFRLLLELYVKAFKLIRCWLLSNIFMWNTLYVSKKILFFKRDVCVLRIGAFISLTVGCMTYALLGDGLLFYTSSRIMTMTISPEDPSVTERKDCSCNFPSQLSFLRLYVVNLKVRAVRDMKSLRSRRALEPCGIWARIGKFTALKKLDFHSIIRN